MASIYVKAKIKKSRGKEETKFEYPKAWDSNKIHVVAYEDNPESMGEVEEYCVGVVTSETWEEIKKDPDIAKVTAAKANEDGEKWRPQKIRVIDRDAAIIALAVPEANRTIEHKNILNPDKPDIGVNRTEKFDIRRFAAPGQKSELEEG